MTVLREIGKLIFPTDTKSWQWRFGNMLLMFCTLDFAIRNHDPGSWFWIAYFVLCVASRIKYAQQDPRATL